MQAKKRAKPVKFGRKPEQPKSADNYKQTVSTIPTEEAGLPTEDPGLQVDMAETPTVKHIHHSEESEQQDQSPADDRQSQSPVGDWRNEVPDDNTAEITGQTVEIVIESKSEEPRESSSPPVIPVIEQKHQNIHNVHVDSESPAQSVPESGQQNDTPAPVHGEDAYIVEKEKKKSILGFFILIAIISFVIGFISMAGINYFQQQSKEHNGIPFLSGSTKSTPSPKPTSKPTPTPEIVNLGEYNIKILNGSGVTGAATKLKQSLDSAGFNVTAIGNADSSTYTDSTITAGKIVKSTYLTKLKDELKKSYFLSSKPGTSPDIAGEIDVVITIGSSLASSSAR